MSNQTNTETNRQDDPNFATSQEDSPLAADDLRRQAESAPRTDKQGDQMPPGNTPSTSGS